MEKLQHFSNITNLMEQNIRGVQIGCYSVALVSLTVALRKVRPFSKFKKPSDIPNHFIKEKRELCGIVKRVDPKGCLLMVQHKPLLNIPFIPVGQLPVKICGVKVSGLGLNWLQAIVVGSEIKFIPVLKDKDFVQCQVLLKQMYKDKKQQPQVKFVNVGEDLLKIGFGVREAIGKPLSEDRSFLVYYNSLQKAENHALRKQLGLKYYVKPTASAIKIIFTQLKTLILLAQKAPSKFIKLYAV